MPNQSLILYNPLYDIKKELPENEADASTGFIDDDLKSNLLEFY
jgi:hypothetical protein